MVEARFQPSPKEASTKYSYPKPGELPSETDTRVFPLELDLDFVPEDKKAEIQRLISENGELLEKIVKLQGEILEASGERAEEICREIESLQSQIGLKEKQVELLLRTRIGKN